MALDESSQLEAKRTMLRTRFGLEPSSLSAAPAALGYRWSSKRVALSMGGQLRLGSYAQGSHEPAPMTGCLVDHPLLSATFDRLERTARELEIEPYDELRGSGDLRYAWAKTNGSEVILTLVTARAQSRVRALLPALSGTLHGVLHSVQDGRGNALRGSAAELLHGSPALPVTLLGQRVEVGALGFLQPNPRVAEQAYEALLRLDTLGPERALAFDLYAGAGLTTRRLRACFAEVSACELNAESAHALAVEALSVEQFLAQQLGREGRHIPDLVVANPPRKGLGPEVVAQLLALGAPALRIMSCGPEGLARDLRQLAPGYELERLEAFDTLPQTPHIELVATLSRRPLPV